MGFLSEIKGKNQEILQCRGFMDRLIQYSELHTDHSELWWCKRKDLAKEVHVIIESRSLAANFEAILPCNVP